MERHLSEYLLLEFNRGLSIEDVLPEPMLNELYDALAQEETVFKIDLIMLLAFYEKDAFSNPIRVVTKDGRGFTLLNEDYKILRQFCIKLKNRFGPEYDDTEYTDEELKSFIKTIKQYFISWIITGSEITHKINLKLVY